jgi:hypothetical protein
VRLARPRLQRLSAAMEHEATALLAALLADAAKRRGAPIGTPVGRPIGTPIPTPKNGPPEVADHQQPSGIGVFLRSPTIEGRSRS